MWAGRSRIRLSWWWQASCIKSEKTMKSSKAAAKKKWKCPFKLNEKLTAGGQHHEQVSSNEGRWKLSYEKDVDEQKSRGNNKVQVASTSNWCFSAVLGLKWERALNQHQWWFYCFFEVFDNKMIVNQYRWHGHFLKWKRHKEKKHQ